MATLIDPRLYAGEIQTPTNVPVGAAGDGSGQSVAGVGSPEFATAAPVEAFLNTPQSRAGDVIQAEGAREKAGTLASIGAGLVQTDTAAIWHTLTDPSFAKAEVPISTHEAMQHLDFVPTAAQSEYLHRNKSGSIEEWNYRVDRVRTLRAAEQASGDNPFASLLATVGGDAIYLATGIGAVSVAARVGRLAGAFTGAAGGASIAGLAAQSKPKSTEEIVLGVMGEAAAGMFVLNKAGKLVPKDPDFPAAELAAVAQPKPQFRVKTPAIFADVTDKATGVTSKVKVADTVFEEVPAALRADTPIVEMDEVAQAVEAEVDAQAKSWSERIGESLQWNTHRTLSGYGPKAKEIADWMIDSNSDLSKTSVESIQRAAKQDLVNLQWKYEDQLRADLANKGFGTIHVLKADARAAQAAIDEQVNLEMYRRAQLFARGRAITFENVPPQIKEMADSLDAVYGKAGEELVRAGVLGAENLKHSTGFVNRVWASGKIMRLEDELIAAGDTAEKAHQRVVRLVALSMRKTNGWDERLAYNIAAATVNRSLRKGKFEDAAYVPGFGADTAAQIRDILKDGGARGAELERAMEVLVGKQDEGAKAGFLKHRIDMDYSASMLVNGRMVRVTDLFDHNISQIVDRYIDGVSTQIAFARAGVKSESALLAKRAELVESLRDNPHKQKEAVKLFDGLVAYMRGEPTGTDIGQGLRNMSMVNRMMSLRNSGVWQLTEYATIMGKYGVLKTLKYAVQELPGFKQLLETASKDKVTSRHLKDILTNNSTQSLRLRPFTSRFEDGFDIDPSQTLTLRLQQAQQLVPHINGMRYVQHHQARITANLILDVISDAAKGNTRAVEQLGKYGITKAKLAGLSDEVRKHGFDVDKWHDAVWDNVRPSFSKMMDESVLHARLGDMPAFALLNPVGKFIFTYRPFVLTAHNKILAGSLGRDGLSGAALIMMYQFPMAAVAVTAQAALNGQAPMDQDELASKALGQMGAIGAFSEIYGWYSGNKKEWGAPGLIPIDRGIGLFGDASSAVRGEGSWGKVGSDVAGIIPLVSLFAPVRALGNLAKEQE